MENGEDVDIMVRVKSYLDAIPEKAQKDSYRVIFRLVETYLIVNCKHNIVEDSIDVDVEKSKTIHYCEKCLLTFDRKT